MATITGHYNVPVDSRYYAFLANDMESAEPDDLLANCEKQRELRKESKSKAKKEKRNKQIAETIKEIGKSESKVEEIAIVETETVVNNKQEVTEKPVEEPQVAEKVNENRSERSARGRGSSNRRQNGGPRRAGHSGRTDDRWSGGEDGERQQRSQEFSEPSRFGANSRGRPFRKDRVEGENYNKVGYFDDQSGGNFRGNSMKRRPSGRGAGRQNRFNNDRSAGERGPVDRNESEQVERSGSSEKYRNESEGNSRTDIIPESMGTFEDVSSRPLRNNRGRYQRPNRGSFNRFSNAPSNSNENDFENNKIGYFDENFENREYRGRGRFRGGRGMRRGRGDYRRPRGSDREENTNDGFSNNIPTDNREVPVPEKWPDSYEDYDEVPVNTEPINHEPVVVENDPIDMKKSNWGEIEDDPMEIKTTENITLEEWKARHGKDRLMSQESKENRKANDGQDVFSGMEEYRKERATEEQTDEHDAHENQHGRQKQSIPMSIRFSRNTELSNFEQTNNDYRTNFSRGGYFNKNDKFNSDGATTSRGGRPRGSSEYFAGGRGRDFNRGRGRFTRNSYPVKRKEVQVDGININLGNEDEFPTLSSS